MSESLTKRADLSVKISGRGRRVTPALYAAAAFLFWAGLYLYVPTLPTYVQSKSNSLATVGMVLAQYGLWQGIVRLPLGIVADWVGRRKPFVIAGFTLAAVGAVTLGLASSVDSLIVGRAITGLAAASWVPLIVLFSSLFPPEEAVRASATLTLVQSVGRILATGINGSLNRLGGYSLTFFLAAGLAALSILAVLSARESRHAPRRPSVGAVGRLVSRRDVLLPALLAAVAQHANWASTYSFLPLLARQLGATEVTQSLLISTSIGVFMLGNLVTRATANRLGGQRLVYVSFTLLFIGLGGAALAPRLPQLFASQLCVGLSQGIGYPVLMGLSIQHVTEANRTTAMGLHQAVYAIGMFSGPWLSGVLADRLGIRWMLALTAFASLLLGLLATHRLVDRRSA